jgi:hypothetical protein
VTDIAAFIRRLPKAAARRFSLSSTAGNALPAPQAPYRM